jgi:hypothetical protein
MKTLALYPIYNQSVRIQPWFRNTEKLFATNIDECLFIDERGQDKSVEVLNLELPNMKIPFKLKQNEGSNRATSITEAIRYGIENDFDFIILFNEGWEDNIEELINIIKNKEFTNYGLVTSCRHVYNLSLGSFLNFFSNLLTSLITKQMIRETKGDSINIINLKTFSNFKTIHNDPAIIHLEMIIHALKNGSKLLFSDVDNGLNYRSFVRLNLLRILKLIKYLLSNRLPNRNS